MQNPQITIPPQFIKNRNIYILCKGNNNYENCEKKKRKTRLLLP